MYKNTVTSTPLSLPALNVDGADGGAVEKKRMLLITNPHASTVNARLHGLVQYALAGRYSLEVASEIVPADIHFEALYDPGMARIRG